jgi:polysaccharide export outer membrane protein
MTTNSPAASIWRTATACSALALAAVGCSHNQVASDFQISVPAAYAPTDVAEIPLAIGDVLQIEYFRSYALDGHYRIGIGDALKVLVRSDDVGGDYRLTLDDQVEVVAKAGNGQNGQYRLQVGDAVRLVIPTRDDLSLTTTILPDGSAVMPLVGPVELRGLTIREAVSRLEGSYAALLDPPKVDLLVIGVAETEIRQKLGLLPDGSGTLPLVGTVQLRGKTVAELTGELSERYADYFFEPKVDLIVTRTEATYAYESTILPDGRATLPLVGAMELSGLTVEEASERLREAYGEHVDDPIVDVLITESGWRANDFFEILRESSNGRARDTTVTDDGMIRLPLIDPIQAASRSFTEVQSDIVAAYSDVLPEIEVNAVFSLGRSQRKISVLGEVTRAGMFDAIQPISALQALALGGGFTDRAWRSQVLLIHPDFEQKTLTVRVVDMKKGLRLGDPSLLATTVRARDIVYVPRKPISDVNLFVQQYIATMIPFELRVDVVAQ